MYFLSTENEDKHVLVCERTLIFLTFLIVIILDTSVKPS